MNTKTMLLSRFKQMLPVELGEPYIVNTCTTPYVFVAFYDSQLHFMENANDINGCEFRLWKASKGFNACKCLAGIIGFDRLYNVTLMALTNHGTRREDLTPYSEMLFEMMAEIERNN
jgi:hypothetical protein